MNAKRRKLYLYLSDVFTRSKGSFTIRDFDPDYSVRNKVISSSTVADYLGLGYESRNYAITSLKQGKKPEKPRNDFSEKAMKHGQDYEVPFGNYIQEYVFPEMIPIVTPDEQFSFSSEFVHDSTGQKISLSATPDMIMYDTEEGEYHVIEIKHPYKDWLTQENYKQEETGLARKYLIKLNHYIQVQIQLLVLGFDTGYLFYHIPGKNGEMLNNFAYFRVKKDVNLWSIILSNLLVAEETSARLYNGEKNMNVEMVLQSIRNFCK